MVLLAFAGCSNAPEAAGTGGDGGTGGGTGGTTGHAGVTSATSGSGGAGGAPGAQAGGAAQTGGTTTGGRANSTGGAATAGGSNGGHATMSSGGASPLAGGGGQPASGGRSASGGAGALGGAGGRAGGSSRGGAGAGGAGAAGSAAGKGGSAGGAGTGGAGGEGPCDIYAAANTPCVAAHSTARALYAAYAGPLYQVRRASDKTTKDVPATGPGGVADMTVQDAFCNGTSCTISILYDQTTNKNDLLKSPVAHWLDNGGTESSATKGKTTLNGHTVYGIYVTGYSDNVAYRNNSTKGVAKGDAAEAMYMVVDGKRFSDQCCFDYGNAETSGNDDGNGTMEAVYFGNDITWGGKGEGNGPWVAGDLENGVFKSDKGGWQSQSLSVPSAKSIVANFATAMLKGPSGNHFTLKGGSAQSGTLTTMWDGVRPSSGYSPKKLQGAIILGTGGDGSNGGTGTFYEGAMTSGNPSDAVDDAIQANIVAAGYGR